VNNRTRRARSLATIGVVLFATMACSLSGLKPAAVAVSPTPAPSYPAGWSELDVSASHFKVGLPDAWPRVRVNAKYRDADMAAANKKSPSAANVFQGALAASTDYALLAAQPDINAILIGATIGATPTDQLDKVAKDFTSGFSGSSGGNYTQGKTAKRQIAIGPAVQTDGTIASSGTTLNVVIVTYIEPSTQKSRTAFAFVFLTNDPATFNPNFDTILQTFRTV